MHKLELVLLVGDGVDVLGNMVGGLLGCHMEVQMGEPVIGWFGGRVQGLVGPCGRRCILVGQKSLDIPPHRICVLKSVKSEPILGQYALQSSHLAAKGYLGCMCEWIKSLDR